MLFELLKSAFEPIRSAWFDRRRVRLSVHKAHFLHSGEECYFVNVTNTSRARDIEITHVWFDANPQVAALQPTRPLPKRLKPEETWETWVEADRLPSIGEAIYTLGRARLSNGKTIHSVKNTGVPGDGVVPGGPA